MAESAAVSLFAMTARLLANSVNSQYPRRRSWNWATGCLPRLATAFASTSSSVSFSPLSSRGLSVVAAFIANARDAHFRLVYEFRFRKGGAMGFLNSLFGEKIENENRTKPFHANNSAAERRDWFFRTRPWHKVHPKITNALIEKFGNDPMFEVFVITSMEQNIVGQYVALGERPQIEEPSIICSHISGMMCILGTASVKAMSDVFQSMETYGDKEHRVMSSHYPIVKNALPLAILLDDNQIGAYVGLAVVSGLMNKPEEGLKYAKAGLSKAQEIQAKNVPFHKSELAEIREGKMAIDEMETYLESLVAQFSTT
jgi:hypothetical protein